MRGRNCQRINRPFERSCTSVLVIALVYLEHPAHMYLAGHEGGRKRATQATHRTTVCCDFIHPLCTEQGAWFAK